MKSLRNLIPFIAAILLGLLIRKDVPTADTTLLHDSSPTPRPVKEYPQTDLAKRSPTLDPFPVVPLVSPSDPPTPQSASPTPSIPPQTCPSDATRQLAKLRQDYRELLTYQPQSDVRWADPTNFGERETTDVAGNPVQNELLVVLHETVISADQAIKRFQTPHPKDEDQVSYHILIRLDGTIIYMVPQENRAYGAGNSVFNGPNGPETVQTNPDLPPSVNNFAYHIGLETPPKVNSTRNDYTKAEYRSLALLLNYLAVPNQRITTHQAIDRTGTRTDPRNFDFTKLFELMQAYQILSQSPQLC